MDDNDDGGGGRPCNQHRADRTEEGNDTVSRVGGLRHIYRKLHRHHHRSHRFSETHSIDPSIYSPISTFLTSPKGLSKMRTYEEPSKRLIRAGFVHVCASCTYAVYMRMYVVCGYVYVRTRVSRIWIVESGCRDLSLSREDVGWSFSIVGLFGARPFRSRAAFSISHPSPHLCRYRATSSFSPFFSSSPVRPIVLYVHVRTSTLFLPFASSFASSLPPTGAHPPKPILHPRHICAHNYGPPYSIG